MKISPLLLMFIFAISCASQDKKANESKSDNADNIWISTIRDGLYKYDGEQFKNYDVPISIMDITSDHHGTMWLAGAGGLYKLGQNGEIINVKVNG